MKSLADCVEACLACLRACEITSAKCIEAGDKSNAALIERCRDCADICNLCIKWFSRQSMFTETLGALCAKLCLACANECDRHADKDKHYRICADACRRCMEACS